MPIKVFNVYDPNGNIVQPSVPATAPAPTPSAAPITDSRTPEQKAAESAKNLNVDFTPNTGGEPSITRSDLVGGRVLTGADGNQYYFAPREYVNRGFLYNINGNPFQMYNSRFLDGDVFKNAQQFTSPEGVPGFVWKKQDAINLQLTNADGDSQVGGYYITGNEPAIIGIGNPNATRDDHLGLMAYVTVPRKVSDQMVQQDYITNDGSSNGLHWDGERGYEYVLKGWVPDMLRKSLPTVNAIMPIVMEVLAPGTGAGATYATWSAGTAATLEALRTGNIEKGVIDLAKIYAVGEVTDLIKYGVNAYMPALDLGNVAKAILGSAGQNAIVQGLYGKDVGKAFIDGGIAAGIGSVAGSISGFSQLPKPIQQVFAAAVTTSLQGKSQKDMDAATLQAAIASGLGAIANGLEANSKIQQELGREATPEELNKFIWYTNRDAAFNNKVYDYMGGVKKDFSLQNGFDTYTLDGVDYKIPTKDLDAFAQTQDWSSWADKQDAASMNITDPSLYLDAKAQKEGWGSDADKAAGTLGGFTSPGEYASATTLGLDTKAEYQDYQNKATIYKSITGKDATIDDVREFIRNIPTTSDAQEVMREIASDKKLEQRDKKYDYNGDGVVDMGDAIEMLKAEKGMSTVEPNPNTKWGQIKGTDEQFRTKVSGKTEEEKVIDFLQKSGLVATPESVMAIMKDWNFDPSNPTAGLDEAAKNHAVVVVPKDIGSNASIEEVSAYVLSKGFKNYSIEGDKTNTYSITGQTKENQDKLDFLGDKLNEYAKSLGKENRYRLTDQEFFDFGDKVRVFNFSPEARKAATLQDILTGNTTNIPVKEYFNEKTGEGWKQNENGDWIFHVEIVLSNGAKVEQEISDVPDEAVKAAQTIHDLAQKYGGDSQAIKDMTSIVAQGGGELVKTVSDALWSTGLVSRDNVVAQTAAALNKWGVGSQSNITKTQEDNITNAIKNAEGVGGKLKAFAQAAYNNPLGATAMLAKEGVQELPWLAIGGGAGAVVAKMYGKAIGFAAARGTNTALDSVEAYGAGYGETYDNVIRRGGTVDQAKTAAFKSGLQAMAIEAGSSWIADGAILKSLMGDATSMTAGTFAKEVGKQFVTGYGEEFAQNLSVQYNSYGTANIDQALNAGTIGGFLQSGVGGGLMSPSVAYNTMVGTDINGSPVTLSEYLSGAKQAVPSTVNFDGALTNDNNLRIGDAFNYSTLYDSNPNITPFEYSTAVSILRSEGIDPTDNAIASITGDVSDLSGQDLTNEINTYKTTLATDSGFPDYDTYKQYKGDTNQYNTKLATDAGFPGYATYKQYGGDLNAYNASLGVKTTAAKEAEAEKKRLAEEAKKEEERKAAEADAARQASVNKAIAEEAEAEKKRLAEEAKKEEERKAAEADAARQASVNKAIAEEAEAEKKRLAEEAKKEEERKAAEKDAARQASVDKAIADQNAGRQTQLTKGLAGLESAAPSGGGAIAPLVPSLLTSKEMKPQFQGALESFQKLTAEPYAGENQFPGLAPQISQDQPMPQENSFYSYGQSQSLDDIFGQGAQNQPSWDQNYIDPLEAMQVNRPFASGGLAGTRYGQYAGGGMATPLMAAGGKLRVNFRHGDAVTGPGDGQSDDIPAMLADGEFVFPADVVAALGNGSTKAGSDKLYDMMHGIRAHVRSAHPKELPPEINSPLDFLKTKPRKARS